MKLRLIGRFILGCAISLACLSIVLSYSTSVQAYYGSSCSQYGIMAYESGGYCKCTSGYVFGNDMFGNERCVSADSVCRDQLGTMSRYNSLSGNCECSSGYAISGGQCKSRNSICRDRLGLMSRYNSLSGSCECSSGYVINNGQCESGASVCRAKHGLRSNYKSLSGTCECASGYTFNDRGQCVEKQNNVYFKLLDINTDDKEAIIKSEYDGRQYLVTYGVGCLSYTINRYKNRNIVVNLGTDYDVDAWDTIVLQDDSQSCDIIRQERTYEDVLDVGDDYGYYGQYNIPATIPTYVAPDISSNLTQTITTTTLEMPMQKNFDVSPDDIESIQAGGTLAHASTFRVCPSIECEVLRYYSEGSVLTISGKYKRDDWYRVEGTTDANQGGKKVVGWIHGSLFVTPPTLNTSTLEPESSTAPDTFATEEVDAPKPNFWKRMWSTFLGWFK